MVCASFLSNPSLQIVDFASCAILRNREHSDEDLADIIQSFAQNVDERFDSLAKGVGLSVGLSKLRPRLA